MTNEQFVELVGNYLYKKQVKKINTKFKKRMQKFVDTNDLNAIQDLKDEWEYMCNHLAADIQYKIKELLPQIDRRYTWRETESDAWGHYEVLKEGYYKTCDLEADLEMKYARKVLDKFKVPKKVFKEYFVL